MDVNWSLEIIPSNTESRLQYSVHLSTTFYKQHEITSDTAGSDKDWCQCSADPANIFTGIVPADRRVANKVPHDFGAKGNAVIN